MKFKSMRDELYHFKVFFRPTLKGSSSGGAHFRTHVYRKKKYFFDPKNQFPKYSPLNSGHPVYRVSMKKVTIGFWSFLENGLKILKNAETCVQSSKNMYFLGGGQNYCTPFRGGRGTPNFIFSKSNPQFVVHFLKEN